MPVELCQRGRRGGCAESEGREDWLLCESNKFLSMKITIRLGITKHPRIEANIARHIHESYSDVDVSHKLLILAMNYTF